jgi:hypothetical protein
MDRHSRAVYSGGDFPHSHLIGRIGDQCSFKLPSCFSANMRRDVAQEQSPAYGDGSLLTEPLQNQLDGTPAHYLVEVAISDPGDWQRT